MADYSTWRIFTYIVTILIDSLTWVYGTFVTLTTIKKDPEVWKFFYFSNRFYSFWNIGFQGLYAAFALFCEVLILKNSNNKNHKLTKQLRGFREVVFAGLIWPSSIMTSWLFWSLHLLDKEFLFPKHGSEMIPSLLNHVMHTLIVPIALCEVFLQPRTSPKSHKTNLAALILIISTYTIVMLYTYVESKTWIYPILNNLYASGHFPLVFLYLVFMSLLSYYIQWPITKIIWGERYLTQKME